jgi:hypothetical protein
MYVLGLRELETKSASDTLATFQEILKDIEDRYKVDDSCLILVLSDQKIHFLSVSEPWMQLQQNALDYVVHKKSSSIG